MHNHADEPDRPELLDEVDQLDEDELFGAGPVAVDDGRAAGIAAGIDPADIPF